MGEKKLSYWDTHEELGPQPPCAGAELDNETGQPDYSYCAAREENELSEKGDEAS
ncbi:hypothetical protein [Pseudidiomarina sp.]|uniref:hypothetical protein n=1 Tax=Pseudidiomarina sp. TaxID=2081707 RepID=UPI003A9758F0